ncbi:pyridoxamine 5'-phosphate oxidase family protein [Streptomyces bottropensis]|uniref:pyridoxamine 5'-phosphate oxidase family protein n=1 Tax=Streptomyces bottropensis TaxID=42235 RepID=UPI0036B2BB28
MRYGRRRFGAVAHLGGSQPVRAIDGTVVAREADEIDAATHSGWSVVVTGEATVVTGPAEQERPARTRPALLGALASPAASTTGFPPLDGPSPSQSRTALRQGAVRHCDGFWRPLPPASAEGECGLRSRRDTRREA